MRSRAPIYLLLGLTLVACEKIGSGGSTSASSPDSVTVLNGQLAQARAVSAQQDSLMQGFQQTTQLLADMDKELSKVKGLQSHVPLDVKGENSGDPQAAYRASLLGKVQEVTALLNKSRSRVAALGDKNKNLSSQVADYQATITNLQAMLEQNKLDLAALNVRVDSLTTANTGLASANAAIADTVTDLRKAANTVYYVVGTKDDLKARGIIVEEGSKFLFFGHKALVPAQARCLRVHGDQQVGRHADRAAHHRQAVQGGVAPGSVAHRAGAGIRRQAHRRPAHFAAGRVLGSVEVPDHRRRRVAPSRNTM